MSSFLQSLTFFDWLPSSRLTRVIAAAHAAFAITVSAALRSVAHATFRDHRDRFFLRFCKRLLRSLSQLALPVIHRDSVCTSRHCLAIPLDESQASLRSHFANRQFISLAFASFIELALASLQDVLRLLSCKVASCIAIAVAIRCGALRWLS